MASLPAPDVLLSERVVVCEARLPDYRADADQGSRQAASVCGVLQIAARKAVGCAAVDAAVVAGELLMQCEQPS